MCLSHSSTVHWDPPQHLWDSRAPMCIWLEPLLQDGAHIMWPQPSHQQLFSQHHTQHLQDLQHGGTNLQVCCLLQVSSGELRVTLGERKVRNHQQLPSHVQKHLQCPLPQGPAVSLPLECFHQLRPPENCMSKSFFQLHHMVIKRHGLSLSALGTGRFEYYRRDCTLLMNQGRELSK